MKPKRIRFLLWQKLLLLLIISMVVLAAGLTIVTWLSLGQAALDIGQDGRLVLSRQTENFLAKLVQGQVDTVDLQLAQAQAAAVYGATLVTEELLNGDLDAEQLAQDVWPIVLQRASNSTILYFVTPAGDLWSYPSLDPQLDLPPDFNLLQEPFFPASDLFQGTPGEVNWSEVHINPFVAEYDLVVDAVAPVIVKGEQQGFVGVSISLPQLIAQFNQRQPFPGSYSFLINQQRQLVAAPPHARTELLPASAASMRGVGDLSDIGNPALDTVLQNMVLGHTSVEQVDIKNELKYLAYQPLGNINWRLGTVVPVPLATAASAELVEAVEIDSARSLRNMLVGGVVLLFIALGVSSVITQRLLSPLRKMVTATENIAGGDLESRVEVINPDEIGDLAIAFNTMTDQLRNLIGSLELQVRERTTELTLSMEVGQRAAAIRDLEALLPTITEFIRAQFGLYYAHVYFVDDLRQNLVIKAGTGSVGRELLKRQHSVPIGRESIVGQVAVTGKAIVVPDTETSEIHNPNPLLPDTRSELAVPLIVETEVIGVLDMQSDQVNTFTETNLTVFEAMATQLAISIDSAQQWASTQIAQQKAEEAIKQLARETWTQKLTTEKRDFAYTYDLSAVRPISEDEQAGSDGLSAPLMVQSQSIGRLMVELSPDQSKSEDEQELLLAVADQLAQKVENLRLFEETQQRATREHIARQITDKMRASRDIETALKAAVEELSKALGTARAVVELQVASEDKPNQSTNGTNQ